MPAQEQGVEAVMEEFLLRVVPDLGQQSWGALAYPTLDFSAQRVLDCYDKGWV